MSDETGPTLPGTAAHFTLADGTRHDVRVSQREYVAWDLTRGRKKWPDAKEAPFLFTSFIVWSAARRVGIWPGNFDGPAGFTELVEDVTLVKDDDDQEDDVIHPTQRAALPD